METDSKFEEHDAGIGKINSWISNIVDPAKGKQLTKYKELKEAGIMCLGYKRKATLLSGIN